MAVPSELSQCRNRKVEASSVHLKKGGRLSFRDRHRQRQCRNLPPRRCTSIGSSPTSSRGGSTCQRPSHVSNPSGGGQILSRPLRRKPDARIRTVRVPSTTPCTL